MYSKDKGKQKRSRRVEEKASHASAEEPVHQKEYKSKGRSGPNLLTIPLHSPSRNATSPVATVAGAEAKPDYQSMSYTDKLSIAAQMVPDLLVGDAKEALDQLLQNPAFIAELAAVGVVFAGLQATPAGPLIDMAMVATLGVDTAWKLGGFLFKSYTAQDEKDLKAAAEDLKGFVEVAGMAGATKLLGMAGRALKNLSGEAKAVEGGTLRTLSDDEAANIWGAAGLGKAKPSTAREVHKAQSHQNRLSRYQYSPKSRTDNQLLKDIQPKLRTGETETKMQQRIQQAQAELSKRKRQQYKEQSSEQRAQKTVSQADQPLQNPLPNAAQRGHGHDWHGNQTTDLQQEIRVKTGTRPDGSTGRAPGTASRFTSPQAEAEALGRADRLLRTDLKNGNVPSFPDPRTSKPTYVDPVTGKPVRHAVTVSTQRQGGFGTRVVKQRDPITGQVLRDPATGQPITARDPIPRSNAKVIWEYRPTTGDWKPVTYYPD